MDDSSTEQKTPRKMTAQEMALAVDEHARWDGQAVRMRAIWRGGDGKNVWVFENGWGRDFARGINIPPEKMQSNLEEIAGGWFDTSQPPRPQVDITIQTNTSGIARAIHNQLKLTKYGFLREFRSFLEDRCLDPRDMAGQVGAVSSPRRMRGDGEEERWLCKWVNRGGPALMVPQRNHLGQLASFTLRFLDPPNGIPKTVYAKQSVAPSKYDGLPLVYGWPHRRDNATLYIGEGWAFPFEARAYFGHDIDTFAVRDAGSMERSARYAHGYRGRVVIVPDLNEVGMRCAAKLKARIGAEIFDWRSVDVSPGVNDLGGLLTARAISKAVMKGGHDDQR